MSHVKLGDLFRVGSSKRVLQSQWTTGGVPFYRGREITKLAESGFVENDLFITEQLFNELSQRSGVPQAGDIMITAIGTIGNSYIVCPDDRFYFKDASVLWLARNSDVSSEYINHWLKSPLFLDQLDRGNGATVDTLTIQKLQGVLVHVPSASEQRRIVTLLDQAFADIATAKANAEKNLQKVTSFFEAHLQAIFSDDDSSWERKTLGNVFATATGTTPPKSNPSFYGDFIPLVKPPELLDDVIESVPDSLTESGAKAARVLPALSVLVSCIGNLGKIGINTAPVCFNQQINAILPNQVKALPDFMFFQALSPVFKKQLEGLASGTTVPIVNKSKFNSIQIGLPPLEQQANIVEQLKALRQETHSLESIYRQKLTALDDLKKSLLHQAFSRQLTQ